jgi:hypothetical protein
MLALVAALVPAVLDSQETTAGDPCDPKLLRQTKDPLGYERRGERCEGLYIQEVAGSAGLLVASFTEAADRVDIVERQPLRVAWSGTAQLPVRLRAVALRRRLYYRMDATRPASPGVFEWPTDLLVSLQIRPQEIGVVGWTEQRVGGKTEDVYVPLRLGTRRVGATGRYVVVIIPGTELSEVYVTLTEVDSEGRDSKTVKHAEPLKYQYYPAERALRVPLPALDRPSLYRLELGAALSRGGSVTRSLFFYHPSG